MFRSEALSKRRPHTLQVRLPSVSSAEACGEPPGDQSGVDPGWCGRGGAEEGASLLLPWVSRTRWVMKRCLPKEPAEAKHTPHCRHWKEAVSTRCCGMCCWNSAPSSVLNPHGTHRKTPSSSSSSAEGSAGVEATDARVLLAGPPPSSPSSVGCSSSSPLSTDEPSPSSSDELSAPVAARFLVSGGPWPSVFR